VIIAVGVLLLWLLGCAFACLLVAIGKESAPAPSSQRGQLLRSAVVC